MAHGSGIAAGLGASWPPDISEGMLRHGPPDGADTCSSQHRPPPRERSPDVVPHRDSRDREDEEAQAATPSTLGGAESTAYDVHDTMITLMHRSLRAPGDYLSKYSDGVLRQTFADDWTACFSSDSPFSALFTLWWARAVCFLIGILTIAIHPWVGSYSDLRRNGMVLDKISMLRFTAVAQRDPTNSGQDRMFNLPSFGLLHGTCKIAANSSAVNTTTAILSFDTPVEEFDGLYVRTSSSDAALDPQVYLLEGTNDGISWTPIYSSLKRDACGCASSSKRPLHALVGLGQHRAFPEARLFEDRVDFNRQECLAPFLVWSASTITGGVGILLAPLAQTVSERIGRRFEMSRPIQIISASCFLTGLMRLSAFSWAFQHGWDLQREAFGYSVATMLAEGLLVIVIVIVTVFVIVVV